MNRSYMNIKHFLFAIALTLIAFSSYAQNVIYNQHGSIPIPINNASSFLHPEGEINFIAKQQWVGLDGAPKLYRLSGSLPFGSKGIMGGLSLTHESASVEKLGEAVAFVGKSIALNEKSFLSVSLGVGASYYNGNFSGIDPMDPVFRDDVKEVSGLLTVGLLYHTNKYYLGLSAPRLSFGKLGLSSADFEKNLYNQYHFIGGTLIAINNDFDLKPAVLATWSRDLNLRADFSAMLYLKKVVGLGANVRTYRDIAGMAQFYIKKLSFGYNYQFNTRKGPLDGSVTSNTHEIMIGYRFGKGVLNLL